MGDMRIYRAPDGRCYRYREGHAPEGYVLVEQKADEPEPAPKPKRRTAANKARKTENK